MSASQGLLSEWSVGCRKDRQENPDTLTRDSDGADKGDGD